GKALVTRGLDPVSHEHVVRLIDPATGKERGAFHHAEAAKERVPLRLVSSDGFYVEETTPDAKGNSTVHLRAIDTGTVVKALPDTARAVTFALTPDEKLLFGPVSMINQFPTPRPFARSESVTFWDARSGQVHFSCPTPNKTEAIVFIDSGKSVAVGGAFSAKQA